MDDETKQLIDEGTGLLIDARNKADPIARAYFTQQAQAHILKLANALAAVSAQRDEAMAALAKISGQAVCVNMDGDDGNEQFLKSIYEIAETFLSTPSAAPALAREESAFRAGAEAMRKKAEKLAYTVKGYPTDLSEAIHALALGHPAAAPLSLSPVFRDVDDLPNGLAALVAGKHALFQCSEDPTIEAARACWQAMWDVLARALDHPAPDTSATPSSPRSASGTA